MIKLANAQLWVHDQEAALDFYTNKVGWVVRADVTLPELGDFRWLTVGPESQPDVSVVLMAIPGPPVMDEETAGQVRALMAKGFAGTVFLTTDDCRASYEELKSRGVEFTEAPEDRPYGTDAGFRDPSGNAIRLTQVREDVLARVLTAEQHQQRFGEGLEAIDDVLVGLELPAREPLRHLGAALRPLSDVIGHHEAGHARMVDEQRQVVRRTADGLERVVLRDRPADHDTRVTSQLRQRRVEDLTADVVEVDVDPVRAVLAQGRRDVL
jgi:predicted enzyme related to lactoylglutathione lyase